MNFEQAIKEAGAKGGYKPKRYVASLDINIQEDRQEIILLDPLFWQALGKARAWALTKHPIRGRYKYMKSWISEWHRFIDHLAEGKPAESFFASL